MDKEFWTKQRDEAQAEIDRVHAQLIAVDDQSGEAFDRYRKRLSSIEENYRRLRELCVAVLNGSVIPKMAQEGRDSLP